MIGWVFRSGRVIMNPIITEEKVQEMAEEFPTINFFLVEN